MTRSRHAAIGLLAALAAGLLPADATLAFGRPVPAADKTPLVHNAQMQGLLELFGEDRDNDGYGHDRHYDFDQYRNSTSRKERIRDYYQMQKDMQKDYWKSQKQMQKNAIKRQRGW